MSKFYTMKKMKMIIISILLLKAGIVLAQPTPDMPIAKYGDNNTPYPLYAGYFGTSPVYDSASIRMLAENFDGLYGNFDIDMKTADSIRYYHPDFQLMKYQGGWILSSQDSRYVEDNKLECLYYKVGSLDATLTAEETTFTITGVFGNLVASTAADDKNDVYYENGEFKFITWVRINEELMRITDVDGNTITVQRGIDGTEATTHFNGTAVTAPVYGRNNPVPGMQDDVQYRHDEGSMLRWNNLLEACRHEYSRNGGGIWIDILIGNLSQLSMNGQNLPGNRIWDSRNKMIYSSNIRSQNVEKGIKHIQDEFYNEYGTWPVIWGNNMLHPDLINDRVNMLVQTTIKPRPIDGFAQENSYGGYGAEDIYSYRDYSEWKEVLESIMFMGEKKLNARPLLLDGGADNKNFSMEPAVKKNSIFMYGYASYLLAVKVEDDDRIFTQLGLCPVIRPLEGNDYFEIDSCLTWDIGRPVETYSNNDYMNYKLPGQDVFKREFEDGLVLVNPTTSLEQVNLMELGGPFRNPDNNNEIVGSVYVLPKGGVILFKDQDLVSTDSKNHEKVKVFPNPAKEFVFIETNDDAFKNIKIYGMDGRKWMDKSFNSASLRISVGRLEPGAYIIKIQSVSRLFTDRFIKK